LNSYSNWLLFYNFTLCVSTSVYRYVCVVCLLAFMHWFIIIDM